MDASTFVAALGAATGAKAVDGRGEGEGESELGHFCE